MWRHSKRQRLPHHRRRTLPSVPCLPLHTLRVARTLSMRYSSAECAKSQRPTKTKPPPLSTVMIPIRRTSKSPVHPVIIIYRTLRCSPKARHVPSRVTVRLASRLSSRVASMALGASRRPPRELTQRAERLSRARRVGRAPTWTRGLESGTLLCKKGGAPRRRGWWPRRPAAPPAAIGPRRRLRLARRARPGGSAPPAWVGRGPGAARRRARPRAGSGAR